MKGQYDTDSSENKALEAVLADQTIESLDNAELKENYPSYWPIRHYANSTDNNESLRINKKKDAIDKYLENVALYAEEPISGYSEEGLNSTEAIEKLGYLSERAVLDKAEVKIYKNALSGIHDLLGPLHIRNPDNFNKVSESKLPLGIATISGIGALAGIGVSLMTSDDNIRSIGGMASYLLGVGSISIYISHSPELSTYPIACHKELLSLHTKAEIVRYEHAVKQHIQNNGMTFDKDLKTAIHYGQKLQDSLQTSKHDPDNIGTIKQAQDYLSWAMLKLERMAEKE